MGRDWQEGEELSRWMAWDRRDRAGQASVAGVAEDWRRLLPDTCTPQPEGKRRGGNLAARAARASVQPEERCLEAEVEKRSLMLEIRGKRERGTGCTGLGTSSILVVLRSCVGEWKKRLASCSL